MITEITKGIKVSIHPEYQVEHSNPAQAHYVFTYKVVIENFNDFSVQLLRRHWYITDLVLGQREVEGEGVVGKQPILEAGESHQYVSACNLKSSIGAMRGKYLMERVLDGKMFEVNIPRFTMVAPQMSN